MKRTAVEVAIEKALKDGYWFGVRMAMIESEWSDVQDVLAICGAMRRAMELPPKERDTAFAVLAPMAYSLEGDAAHEAYFTHGLPVLIEYFDDLAPRVQEDKQWATLVHSLRVMVELKAPETLDRLTAAARHPDARSFFWTVLFRILSSHPWKEDVLNRLSLQLPRGAALSAFLDWANQLCLQDKCARHPFDSEAGVQTLSAMIEHTHPDEDGHAISAIVAFAFIDRPERNRLLAIALDHPNAGVQMEAAWVAASLGREAGFRMLGQFCLLSEKAEIARRYLREFGREDMIPAEGRDPDFVAESTMVSWLRHPMEFGRSPDQIELYDTRELFWPPTDDKRRVWLFKFVYRNKEKAAEETGLGMVGSVTFALSSETTADLTPEDAYAIHCCWELQMNKDPRAPEKRTAAIGRAILAQANGW